jgi:hypothetical protein
MVRGGGCQSECVMDGCKSEATGRKTWDDLDEWTGTASRRRDSELLGIVGTTVHTGWRRLVTDPVGVVTPARVAGIRTFTVSDR